VLLVTAPGPHSVSVRLWGGPAIRVQDNMNRTGGSQAGLPAGREQGRGEDTTRTDGRIHPLVGCRRSALIHGALSSVQRPPPCMRVAVPSRVRHTITRQSPKACAPPKALRDGTTHSQVELHGYLTGCDTGRRQQATETASTSLPSPLLQRFCPEQTQSRNCVDWLANYCRIHAICVRSAESMSRSGGLPGAGAVTVRHMAQEQNRSCTFTTQRGRKAGGVENGPRYYSYTK
jgi:hypothetical protein